MLYIENIFIYLILLSIGILISKKLEFTDKPNRNRRTVHKTSIINTGGLILYLFFLLTTFKYEVDRNIELIIHSASIIVLIGFIDDRINLSPKIKILFISILCFYLISKGIRIYDLGDYDLIGKLNLGKFGFIFLLLASGLLINATNYSDGVDGLLLIFFLICLNYYLFLTDNSDLKYFIKILIIPVLINLFFNLLPEKTNLKIFSGNTGSLFVGFFISFLTIELYRNYKIHPTFLIWPLWYPVYDFLYVSLNRFIKNKSIFEADNNHFHHYLLKKFNNNHYLSTLVFAILNIVVIFLGYKLTEQSKLFSLILFFICFFIYFLFRKIIDKY